MIIAEASAHDEQVALAEELMDKEDYSGAAHESGKVLEELEDHLPTIAQAALVKGRAMTTHALVEMSESGTLPPPKTFEEIWKLYQLSEQLNPECEQTQQELLKVSHLLRELPPPKPPKEVIAADYDVLVVGAGASGVGTACLLTKTFGLDKKRVTLIERGSHVGESFRQWPKEMRFISPSFNQQGWTNSFDLNAIVHGTSPAFSLHSEHPSGLEYAAYLRAIAKTFDLNVQTNTEVVSIKSIGKSKELPLFSVALREESKVKESDKTKKEDVDKLLDSTRPPIVTKTVTARYIVWAAGEFQYPNIPKETDKDLANFQKKSDPPSGEEKKDDDLTLDFIVNNMPNDLATFYDDDNEGDKKNNQTKDEEKELNIPKAPTTPLPDTTIDADGDLVGAQLCLHNSKVRSWKDLEGDDFIVIGGYESGVDATVNLSKAGKKCTVMASTPCWSTKTTDPSAELAPYTASRLRDVLSPENSCPKPKLMAPLRVVKVERAKNASDEKGFQVTAVWGEPEDAPHAPLRDHTLGLGGQEEPAGKPGSIVTLFTKQPPILCTGFEGSVAAAAGHLFDFHDSNGQGGCSDGAPKLTDVDESTKVPGVFLVGPTVTHGKHVLCFVYKYRQRFAIVANAICGGLGVDTKAAVKECRKANMFLDEFSCCEDTCGDVC